MKTLIIVLLLLLTACHQETAVEQIEKIKKPAIVFSKHKADGWLDADQFTVKDAIGKLIEIDGVYRAQLCDKYNVGDTIR